MNTNNKNLSEKKVYVACDFSLPLRMFNLPEIYANKIKQAFPNINIIFIPKEINKLSSLNIKALENVTIYWGNLFSPKMLKIMPKLEWIHFGSVGVEKANSEDVKQRNIRITNSINIVEEAMTTSAIAAMTNLARGIFRAEKLRVTKKLNRHSWDLYGEHINDFFGSHVLIVGYGAVGRKLAKICKAFDMKVSAVNRSHVPDNNVDKFYKLSNVTSVLKDIDFVINLLPLTDETEQFFSENFFKKMKKKSFFINIGRGETVVEEDLIFALNNRTISAAALDVFFKEPLSLDSPLWDVENAIITPHVAGYTNQYWPKQTDLFMELLGNHLGIPSNE